MTKTSLGFLFMLISSLLSLILHAIPALLIISQNDYPSYLMISRTMTLLIMFIGIIFILVEHTKDLFTLITGIFLLTTPIISVLIGFYQLGFGEYTLGEALLLANYIQFIPLFMYLFIFSFYKYLNPVGKAFTITYVVVGTSKTVIVYILQTFFSMLYDQNISIYLVTVNQVINYIISGVLVVVLIMNIERTLKKVQLERLS